jgi:hypothetical protein
VRIAQQGTADGFDRRAELESEVAHDRAVARCGGGVAADLAVREEDFGEAAIAEACALSAFVRVVVGGDAERALGRSFQRVRPAPPFRDQLG